MRRSQTSPYLNFIRVVVGGNIDQVADCLAGNPAFAVTAAGVGATRQESSTFFFPDIAHYLYAGDTLSTWPRRHFGARSPHCWWPTEQIVGRGIAEAQSRFITRPMPTGGIRARKGDDQYSSRLAPIPTPWIGPACPRCIGPCARDRWRRYGRS